MPKTVKSVAKHYLWNTNYDLDARHFESIIKVLEQSADNLNKPQAAHIVLQIDTLDFDKSLINETLKLALGKNLNAGYGYYLAMESSQYSGYHIHIMLTFSTGANLSFTILTAATDALKNIEGVNTAIALPRKTDRSVSIDTKDYYTAFKKINTDNHYFHNLNDEVQLNDAVHRYSYLAKKETKEELKGLRRTQPKVPTASKTKQEQKKKDRKKERVSNNEERTLQNKYIIQSISY